VGECYATRDQGKTWTFATDTSWAMRDGKRFPAEVTGLACSGSEILAGGRNRSFSHSRDDDATWDAMELDGLWSKPPMVTLTAAFLADTGEAYIGGEGYDQPGKGTLVGRIAP